MITLVLGGARSGKSVVAEHLAERGGALVTYVATLRVGDDEDLIARVNAHRARRPEHWSTVEVGEDLAKVLDQTTGTVLLDSLGPWLAALTTSPDIEGLCATLHRRVADTIIVSDEVGLGVHPETLEGRTFRDALGVVNQAIASLADHVLLVVAGCVLPLKSGVE